MRHSLIIMCCMSLPKLRQHSLIHQARNYDAYCAIVSGLVCHMVLLEFAQAQAAQYGTPSRDYDAKWYIILC